MDNTSNLKNKDLDIICNKFLKIKLKEKNNSKNCKLFKPKNKITKCHNCSKCINFIKYPKKCVKKS